MHHDIPGPRRPRTVLRRVIPHLLRALAYCGASAWVSPPVVTYLMVPGQERDGDGRADPDRVTPYADLPVRERQLFLELDALLETRGAP
jgi:hypothetical protein